MLLSCKDLVNQSTDFTEDNCSWSKRLSIRFHLLMCHHCRRFIRHKKTAHEYLFKQQKLTEFSSSEIDEKIEQIMQQLKSSQDEKPTNADS